MMQRSTSGSKVGAGKSIINRHERSFHRGSLMFIEGESSSEMFIIRSGTIRILKQEGQNSVELARLGPGSVLGELSLLDHQPRSATAQVVEDTTVTVIDEELFLRTLKSIPNWLENIIQLVVHRLRDTMKKTGEDIVTKSMNGVIQILLLLSEGTPAEYELLVSTLKEQVCAVIGLGGLEIEQILLHLVMKEFLFIRKNDRGQEYIVIREREALKLYMQYLRIHLRGGNLIGESFGGEVLDLIGTLLAAGEKNGTVTADRLVRLTWQQVEIELARSGGERHINLDALDELTEGKLVAFQKDTTVSKHGHHDKKTLLFNPNILRNIRTLHQWLPLFKEEIRF
ncbi:MAG: cyclic nucleotide-binding domain-containing protein [Chitinispirillaceae bacterium]|nr:cyclic nucleotide-binding domain-containing protein [Chitinispirillaceae bacterium]